MTYRYMYTFGANVKSVLFCEVPVDKARRELVPDPRVELKIKLTFGR